MHWILFKSKLISSLLLNKKNNPEQFFLSCSWHGCYISVSDVRVVSYSNSNISLKAEP